MAERQCTALLPNGQPCGRDTYGRAWCDKHKGLAKHYRNYKTANAAIAETITIPPQQLDDVQLDREQTQLFTSVTQRQHLKDVGYAGASDSGHDYRIEWEGKRLSEVLTEGQRRQAAQVVRLDNDEDDAPRPARATSSRKSRQRKSTSVTNTNIKFMMQKDAGLAVASKISKDIDAGLDAMVISQLTKRYGDKASQLYNIAMKCAWQLCITTMCSHKLHRAHARGEPVVMKSTDLFMIPPIGFTVQDVNPKGIVKRNGFELINVVKIWAHLVVLNTFGIKYDSSVFEQLPSKYVVLLGIVNQDNAQSVIDIITEVSEHIIGKAKAFREDWHAITNRCASGVKKPLPTISISFCEMLLNQGITQWQLSYIGNHRYAYVVDDIICGVSIIPEKFFMISETMLAVYVDIKMLTDVITQCTPTQNTTLHEVIVAMLQCGVALIPMVKPDTQDNTSACNVM